MTTLGSGHRAIDLTDFAELEPPEVPIDLRLKHGLSECDFKDTSRFQLSAFGDLLAESGSVRDTFSDPTRDRQTHVEPLCVQTDFREEGREFRLSEWARSGA